MTKTEIALLAVHKAPVVPLLDICERYLGMGSEIAMRRAALNRLPFPTFRLNESQKAPVMVDISDLASHIDAQKKCAQESWENSKV